MITGRGGDHLGRARYSMSLLNFFWRKQERPTKTHQIGAMKKMKGGGISNGVRPDGKAEGVTDVVPSTARDQTDSRQLTGMGPL